MGLGRVEEVRNNAFRQHKWADRTFDVPAGFGGPPKYAA